MVTKDINKTVTDPCGVCGHQIHTSIRRGTGVCSSQCEHVATGEKRPIQDQLAGMSPRRRRDAFPRWWGRHKEQYPDRKEALAKWSAKGTEGDEG